MNVKRVEITPTQAASYLSKNLFNRKMQPTKVKQYAADMVAERWLENGETISFASDGSLMNGQHRLAACVLSKKSFTTLVVTGMDKEVFATIDTGKNRNLSDVLGISGEENSALLASTLRVLFKYERGMLGGKSQTNTTHGALLETYARHPLLRKSVKATKAQASRFRTGASAFIDYMGSLVDQERTVLFMQRLRTGANLDINDPALLLRNRISESGMHGSNSPSVLYALHVKALNAALTGVYPKVLRYSLNDNFPSVIGFPYGKLVIPGKDADGSGVQEVFSIGDAKIMMNGSGSVLGSTSGIAYNATV